jgi:hypothetical protein
MMIVMMKDKIEAAARRNEYSEPLLPWLLEVTGNSAALEAATARTQALSLFPGRVITQPHGMRATTAMRTSHKATVVGSMIRRHRLPASKSAVQCSPPEALCTAFEFAERRHNPLAAL